MNESSELEPDRPSSRRPLVESAFRDGAPAVELHEGRYKIHFAQTPEGLAAAQRLRYEVFNLELGEGLEESHLRGRDEDPFDASCHHLLVTDEKTGDVIGTYRMQTRQMARLHRGFYSDGEYDLSGLTEPVLEDSVEIGRACVARAHRKQRVLFGLWKGLAAYMMHTGRRYLFGCCSLTSQDPREGRALMDRLRADGLVHPDLRVEPRLAHRCVDPDPAPPNPRSVKLPTLFGTYLRFGALVCSEPALDRAFKTIDYLVLMDTTTLPARTRQTFFGG